MWNFKHDHILSLLAICLDNDPAFLILELMEAGGIFCKKNGKKERKIGKLHSGFNLNSRFNFCCFVLITPIFASIIFFVSLQNIKLCCRAGTCSPTSGPTDPAPCPAWTASG